MTMCAETSFTSLRTHLSCNNRTAMAFRRTNSSVYPNPGGAVIDVTFNPNTVTNVNKCRKFLINSCSVIYSRVIRKKIYNTYQLMHNTSFDAVYDSCHFLFVVYLSCEMGDNRGV